MDINAFVYYIYESCIYGISGCKIVQDRIMEMNIDICIISKGAEMYKICVIRKILNMWSGMKIDKGNGC